MEYCTPHTIKENILDEIVENEVKSLRDKILAESDRYDSIIKDWLKKKPMYEQQINANTDKIQTLKQQIEDLIMERIGDREHAEIYNEMIRKREEEIAALEKNTADLKEYDKVCRQQKEQLKNTTQILDEVQCQKVICIKIGFTLCKPNLYPKSTSFGRPPRSLGCLVTIK